MDLTRREALVAGAMFLARPTRSVAALRPQGADLNPSLWVSILLRGGADGLYLAPPRGDRHYRSARAELDPGAGLSIGSGFSLHPALDPLAPLVQQKRLALVPAVGVPAPTRSHFQAQDRLEWGLPGSHGGNSGWLARALEAEDGPLLHALAIAPALPMALRGSSSLALEHPAQLGLASVSRAALRALRSRYAASPDAASQAGLTALALWDALEPSLRRAGATRRAENRRRQRPRLSLTASVEQAIALDENGVTLSNLWLESDGWDTHRGQAPAAQRALSDLGDALAKLWSHFGAKREVTLVVSTEFGRTLRPNGSGGTDHGTGSAALVMGTRVRGGVTGAWPGLSESALFEGRDVAAVIDLRDVYAESLEAHLRRSLSPKVFPALERSSLGLFEAGPR